MFLVLEDIKDLFPLVFTIFRDLILNSQELLVIIISNNPFMYFIFPAYNNRNKPFQRNSFINILFKRLT